MNPEPLPASFGAWVRSLRRRLDLTQAGLGARAGCSAAAVRKIEADERKPSRELAVLLVRALAVPEADQARFLQAARGEPLDLSAPLPNPHRTAPTNLPALLTSTVDRTRDHAAVSALLKTEGVRLVTLIGPPGIGKTRLSLLCGAEALPDFPDGVWFVDLAEISQAGFFVAAVARSIPDLDLPPSPGLPQLSSALKERRLLLILDNFEHIVEQAALEAAGLLKACPRLKILATSRAPLRLY
nr:helix-turn-helix domain-containing protein [Anaerolinea sp.]